MKKLMIAAGVAMLGIAANAAACSWSVDTVYKSDGSGNNATGYAAYYIDSSLWGASMASDIAKGNFTDFLAKSYLADSLLDDGYTDGKGATFSGETKSEYGNNYTPKAYLVVFDADEIGNAKNFFVSDETTAFKATTDVGGNAQMSFGDLDASESKDSWTQVAPEPTSGLLLLIGVAGLALRRRRA